MAPAVRRHPKGVRRATGTPGGAGVLVRPPRAVLGGPGRPGRARRDVGGARRHDLDAATSDHGRPRGPSGHVHAQLRVAPDRGRRGAGTRGGARPDRAGDLHRRARGLPARRAGADRGRLRRPLPRPRGLDRGRTVRLSVSRGRRPPRLRGRLRVRDPRRRPAPGGARGTRRARAERAAPHRLSGAPVPHGRRGRKRRRALSGRPHRSLAARRHRGSHGRHGRDSRHERSPVGHRGGGAGRERCRRVPHHVLLRAERHGRDQAGGRAPARPRRPAPAGADAPAARPACPRGAGTTRHAAASRGQGAPRGRRAGHALGEGSDA